MNTDSASERTGKTHYRSRDLIPVWFMIAFFGVATVIWARVLILQILNSEFDVGAWRSVSAVFYMIGCVLSHSYSLYLPGVDCAGPQYRTHPFGSSSSST